MKRTQRRSTRWTKKARSTPEYTRREAGVPVRVPDIREATRSALGPYEAVYDVSLGYSHDRSIVLP